MPQLAGREDHILQHRLVLEEVERLEHHAHLLAQPVDGIAIGENVLPIDNDAAASGLFKQVQAAQESTLASARGTDDGDDLAAMDIHIDVAQDIDGAVTLLKVGDGK